MLCTEWMRPGCQNPTAAQDRRRRTSDTAETSVPRPSPLPIAPTCPPPPPHALGNSAALEPGSFQPVVRQLGVCGSSPLVVGHYTTQQPQPGRVICHIRLVRML